MDKKQTNRRAQRYDCVEPSTFKTMQRICAGSGAACFVFSILFIGVGIFLPLCVSRVTYVTTWYSMLFEAVAVGCYCLYYWIAKNTIPRKEAPRAADTRSNET